MCTTISDKEAIFNREKGQIVTFTSLVYRDSLENICGRQAQEGCVLKEAINSCWQ